MGLACKITWIVIVSLAIVIVALGLYFGLRKRPDPPFKLSHGAIVSNGGPCADIGKNIMESGGSAIDTAIAVMLCEGVVLPHSMGVGGGLFATMYTKETRRIQSIVARDRAPLAANETMFVGWPSSRITGAIASAVPGELLAYSELHKKHGKLDWEKLFEPTIDLCLNGITVSKYLYGALKQYQDRIENEPSMDIFVNSKTGKIWQEGDTMYRPQLAHTFKIIAKDGVDAFYKGELGRKFVEDVKELGGIITEEDLKEYYVGWPSAINSVLRGKYQYYTTEFPSSGPLNVFILNLMDELYTKNQTLYWHRLVESFKHAHGQRTQMGDRDFEPHLSQLYMNLTSKKFSDGILDLIKDDQTFNDFAYYGANFSSAEDHGTASMSVIHPNGDGITLTSTINTFFGGKVRSKQTGIILNDSMDDFATPGVVNAYGLPASAANFIKPGKRPISSMTPSIILNNDGEIQMLVGAAGGPKIVTAVCQVILRYFYFDENIESAVVNQRLHHQLAPNEVSHEFNFDEKVLDFLKSVGHELKSAGQNDGFAALTAIGVQDYNPIPVYDSRRLGSIAIIKSEDIKK